jgi:hypothetical protein
MTAQESTSPALRFSTRGIPLGARLSTWNNAFGRSLSLVVRSTAGTIAPIRGRI